MRTTAILKRDNLSLVLLTGVFSLLLLLSPLAISFTPSESIYRDGVWSGTYVTDQWYATRVALIVLGLSGSVLSLGAWFLTACVRPEWRALTLATSVCAATCALGWCLYPFWVNGIYQAWTGRARIVDLDPKALPPMTWIGELWRLPGFVICLAGFAIQIAVLMVGAWSIRKQWHRTPSFWGVVVLALCHLAGGYYLLGYIAWLLD